MWADRLVGGSTCGRIDLWVDRLVGGSTCGWIDFRSLNQNYAASTLVLVLELVRVFGFSLAISSNASRWAVYTSQRVDLQFLANKHNV